MLLKVGITYAVFLTRYANTLCHKRLWLLEQNSSFSIVLREIDIHDPAICE